MKKAFTPLEKLKSMIYYLYKRKKFLTGFTLIELIIGIVLVTVIAVVVLLVLRK